MSTFAATVGLLLTTSACSPSPAPREQPPVTRSAEVRSQADPSSAPEETTAPTPPRPTTSAATSAASSQPAASQPPPRVCAPSAAASAPRDRRDADALSTCAFERTGHDAIGSQCATTAHEVSVARLNEAVAIPGAVAAKLRRQWKKGKALGLNPDAFAAVGDSITASPKFLGPIVHASSHQSDAVAAALSLEGESIVARYRGKPVVVTLDSFSAPRAAKVGAPSGWAMPKGVSAAGSPVGRLLRTHKPAIVLLMYGSNDAAVRFVVHDELVSGFRERMGRIVDALEAAGVIVVMHTVPRHMHDPSRPDCDAKQGDLSNWRMAVQTSAVSAAAAELACSRDLPLIDLRHAFDALLNHGIGPDGVHPNAHPAGAAKLDDEGLRCGYNVRNYVTLRMLREIHVALEAEPAAR